MTLIRPAGEADLEDMRALFREYVAGLGLDLGFQGFEAELATLPGRYVPPAGAMLIARAADGAPLGCVAMRPLGGGDCEMKRLYVRPQARGMALGRRLATAILDAGSAAGHRRMVLDTLATLRPALRLYHSLGFRETSAYYDNPLPGAIYLARALQRSCRTAARSPS